MGPGPGLAPLLRHPAARGLAGGRADRARVVRGRPARRQLQPRHRGRAGEVRDGVPGDADTAHGGQRGGGDRGSGVRCGGAGALSFGNNLFRKSQNFSASDAWSLPVLLPRQVGAGGALGLLNTESHNTTSIFIYFCQFAVTLN